MSYRFGKYLNAQPDDKLEVCIEVAKDKARQLSNDKQGSPIAVWNEDDRTLFLYAGYEEFAPTTPRHH